MHVTGEALYSGDVPLPAGTLHMAYVCAPRARARLRRPPDYSRALAMSGVVSPANQIYKNINCQLFSI
jgi:xanthine dehydrogenase molybdopterin-binding subunit B